MNRRPKRHRPAFLATALCWLLAPSVTLGREMQQETLMESDPSPQAPVTEDHVVGHSELGNHGVCDALDARIGRLPAAAKRREAGESLEARRRRLIADVEVEAAFAAAAASLDLDEEPEWRDRFARRRAAVLMRTLEASFASGVTVEPADVERRFTAHPERFRSPEKISTSFILLDLPPDASPDVVEEARSRLREIRAEHAAGERFGALARRYSAAENAARGGAVAASPRGGLLAAYEEVAWALSPGEVSAPFRLPDGMAIVRLENRFPARELSLREARPGIEKRLAWEKAQARRESALTEARSRWPATIDWPDGAAAPNEIRFDGQTLTLEDLGLVSRPPRLRARVAGELDRRRLARLAEYRRLAEHSPAAQTLAALRESMLAAAALESRVAALVPEPSEAELRASYARDLRRFPNPERRAFEVRFLPGAEGALRLLREEAERQAAQWRSGSPPDALEAWGPLARSDIGASTSPLLAGIAFGLSVGEVSEPVRLERYRPETARFEAEGYVVLRLLEIESASTLPYEAVRDRLASFLTREARDRASRTLRAELAAGLDLDRALGRFRDCALEQPARRRGTPLENQP